MTQQLRVVTTGYGENFFSPAVSIASSLQLRLYKMIAHNRSGGAVDVGLVKKFKDANTAFKAYTITAASTPDAAEVTDALIAGTSTAIFTTTNNDGFLIQSQNKFNLIAFLVSQAESGSPVYTYQYFNGTAYSTLTTIAVPAAYSAGKKVVAFNAPLDWATGSSAAVGGELTGYYSILVRATTASGQSVLVANTAGSAISIGSFLDFREGVADNGSVEFSVDVSDPVFTFDAGENVAGYFGGTASASNSLMVQYVSV